MSDEVLMWLSIWSEVQMICIWSSWCHWHPIISCSSKIENGLPSWCQLTRVVLEKRPLNGCSGSSNSSSSYFTFTANDVLCDRCIVARGSGAPACMSAEIPSRCVTWGKSRWDCRRRCCWAWVPKKMTRTTISRRLSLWYHTDSRLLQAW